MEAIGSEIQIIMVDIRIGGKVHDVTRRPVAAALTKAAAAIRSVGVVASIRRGTWSVAHNILEPYSQDEGPYRDKDHVLGIPDEKGNIPPAVVKANLETEHTAEICMAAIRHGGFV